MYRTRVRCPIGRLDPAAYPQPQQGWTALSRACDGGGILLELAKYQLQPVDREVAAAANGTSPLIQHHRLGAERKTARRRSGHP